MKITFIYILLDSLMIWYLMSSNCNNSLWFDLGCLWKKKNGFSRGKWVVVLEDNVNMDCSYLLLLLCLGVTINIVLYLCTYYVYLNLPLLWNRQAWLVFCIFTFFSFFLCTLIIEISLTKTVKNSSWYLLVATTKIANKYLTLWP